MYLTRKQICKLRNAKSETKNLTMDNKVELLSTVRKNGGNYGQ